MKRKKTRKRRDWAKEWTYALASPHAHLLLVDSGESTCHPYGSHQAGRPDFGHRASSKVDCFNMMTGFIAMWRFVMDLTLAKARS